MSSSEVISMGCRLNHYESDVISEYLKENKIDDVIVINSCAVTSEAVRQTKQKIRKSKKNNPDKKIIITGCAAQIEAEYFAKMDEVSKVIGNHEKLLPVTFKNIMDNDEKIIVDDIMSVKETAGHIIKGFDKRARSYLQIQNGCNHRCTFCIIPYGRGNSRSVPTGIIIDQIKQATDNGVNEIVLTGVDITSWGEDLPGSPKLGHLVSKILKLTNIPRLRLSSIDSIEIDSELLEIIIHEKRFMPHLHLSLQSGDNIILKRMKRRHNREQALNLCHMLTEKRPEIAFGADIIAGFPTETDEMFQQSANFIKEANIVYGHIFPFSPRKGTPAERMPQVEKKIIKKRAGILRKISSQNLDKFYKSLIGTTQNVIIETNGIARCENFAQIQLETDMPIGSVQKVKISNLSESNLYGTKLNPTQSTGESKMSTDLSYVIEHDDIVSMTTKVISKQLSNKQASVPELCDMIENVFNSFQIISEKRPALSYKDLMS